MQTEQNKNLADTNSFDLMAAIKEYVRHWKLFLVLVSLFFVTASIVFFTTGPQYNVVSSVILKEDNGGGGSLIGLEELGLISTTSNIDNEIAVFKSPDLMTEVVKSLELQTSYWRDTGLKEIEIYKQTPFFVTLEGLLLRSGEKIELKINPEKSFIQVKGSYYSVGRKEKYEFENKIDTLPCHVNLPDNKGRLFILKNKNFSEELASAYYVQINNTDDAAVNLIKKISISAETKNASVLNMGIVIENKEKGRELLSELVFKYNQENVRDNNQTAYKTSLFVNDRLKDIAEELDEVERGVEGYKQGEGITNLSSETHLYMEQTRQNEQTKLEIETKLGVIKMIEEYVNKSENTYKPIPNIGINDPALVTSITDYNSKLLEYERLLVSIGDENPLKNQMSEEILQMFNSIKESISSVKHAMELSKKNIDLQNSIVSRRIYSLPKQERGLLEKMRQQQIKENLYLFLLQKREETNIAMAAVPDKAKIIIKPRLQKKVAPDVKKIYFISILLGVALGIAIVYFKGLFRVTISSRKELEELSHVPVIGQISKKEELESIVVKKGSTSSIIELFRNLRNSIGFIVGTGNKTVVMVTSTVAGEGKSFVGSNLAVSFALNSKKVLIIGLDIRNPQLAKNFEVPLSKGVTSYLNGDVDDWKSLLYSYEKQPNLEILQAGIVPPNPNELLMSPLLNKLIEEAKMEYDVVILDTAPVGIISDTYLLSQYPDVTLYIVREGYTHKDSASFINEQKDTNRLSNMYIVLNDVDSKNDNYRYGYGRAYGYGDK